MRIDDQILLNQLAQGVVDAREGERWFNSLGEGEKRRALQDLNFMILNAKLRSDDAPAAIAKSGLKPTYTPCVLLQKGAQLGKIANLPESELPKAFVLLVALLGVCDERRRREKPLDTGNHWWHRDLSDPTVIALIRREFGN